MPNSPNDPFYRYKMPKMVLKQESRLNGVKTNIFNLDEVAQALRVPSDGKWYLILTSISYNEVLLRWAGCLDGEDLDRERSAQLWNPSPPTRQVRAFPAIL